ncbi:MAG: IclR family transcriptional regulator [Chloroflexi bacterium]|nr:IclR family transcriptional regulator [Chloroflexota bacterium]
MTPPTPSRQTQPVQSIQRAISILRCFTETEPELSVNELSQRLHLHKSTVSRILGTLERERLVGRDPETGKYHLGLGMVSLAGVALGRLDVRGIAQPFLNQLVEASQETVNVIVLEEREAVNIARAASPQSIRYVGWIGRRIPLHCTAPGLVLLAPLDRRQQRDFLRPPLKAYTPRTLISQGILLQRLQQVQQQGYAIVHEEFEEGYSGIAAPIKDHQNQVVAALVITGPTFRMGPGDIETFIGSLLQTTFAISQQLGYTGGVYRDVTNHTL